MPYSQHGFTLFVHPTPWWLSPSIRRLSSYTQTVQTMQTPSVTSGKANDVTATVCLLLPSCFVAAYLFPSVMCRCQSLTIPHHPASTNQLPPITSSVSSQGRPDRHDKSQLDLPLGGPPFCPVFWFMDWFAVAWLELFDAIHIWDIYIYIYQNSI